MITRKDRSAEIAVSLEVEQRVLAAIRLKTGIDLPRLATGEKTFGAERSAILAVIRPLFSEVNDDAIRSVMYGLFRGTKVSEEIDFLIHSFYGETSKDVCLSLSTLLVGAVRSNTVERILMCFCRNVHKLELDGLKCLLKHANEVDGVRHTLCMGLSAEIVDAESVLCLANYTPKLYSGLVNCDERLDGLHLPNRPDDLLKRYDALYSTGQYTMANAASIAVYGKITNSNLASG